MKKGWIFLFGLVCATVGSAQAEQVGSVDTVFKLLGPATTKSWWKRSTIRMLKM